MCATTPKINQSIPLRFEPVPQTHSKYHKSSLTKSPIVHPTVTARTNHGHPRRITNYRKPLRARHTHSNTPINITNKPDPQHWLKWDQTNPELTCSTAASQLITSFSTKSVLSAFSATSIGPELLFEDGDVNSRTNGDVNGSLGGLQCLRHLHNGSLLG